VAGRAKASEGSRLNPRPTRRNRDTIQAVTSNRSDPLAQSLALNRKETEIWLAKIDLWSGLPEMGRKLLRVTVETLAGELPHGQMKRGSKDTGHPRTRGHLIKLRASLDEKPG
jgi:hypothetical protein